MPAARRGAGSIPRARRESVCALIGARGAPRRSAVSSVVSEVDSDAPSRAAQGSPNPKDDAIAFKDPEALTPEEERKLKLEVGTNWRPRTSTVKGEGYQFFQGPSPKTSVQEGMPDFFSSDNFADSDAGAGKLFIPLAGVLTLGLAAVLASS